MASAADTPRPVNAIDIAREALRRLALQRVAPTPDNYKVLYEEIAGTRSTPDPAVAVVSELTSQLARALPDLGDAAQKLRRAVGARQWSQCRPALDEIGQRLRSGATPGGENLGLIRDLLANTLEYCVVPQLDAQPELAARAQNLVAATRLANSADGLRELAATLKHLWLDVELGSAVGNEQQALLRNILMLLLENISELIEEDTWLAGQLASVRELVSGTPGLAALKHAEKRLKEVVYKQSMAHHGLREATAALKATMGSFIVQLGAAVAANDTYQTQIADYAEIVRNTDDVLTLAHVLEDLQRDTRAAQADTRRVHADLVAEQRQAMSAESRIRALERELSSMSARVREDPLTKSLNRRGLDEEFEREAARADRYRSTFCVVVLDLDNFKALNDAHGHRVGDAALAHLVEVAKRALRPFDHIARLGGEEFLFILPRTNLDEALKVAERVQRALTRKLFMDGVEHVLVTFSAGVAERAPGEAQALAIERADTAMYEAKRLGKNRVCAAEPSYLAATPAPVTSGATLKGGSLTA